MEYRINLVEDEPNLNQLLRSYLRQEGLAGALVPGRQGVCLGVRKRERKSA